MPRRGTMPNSWRSAATQPSDRRHHGRGGQPAPPDRSRDVQRPDHPRSERGHPEVHLERPEGIREGLGDRARPEDRARRQRRGPAGGDRPRLQEPQPVIVVEGPLHVLGPVERSGGVVGEASQAPATRRGQQGACTRCRGADPPAPPSEHDVGRGHRAAHEGVRGARDGFHDEVAAVPGDGIEAEEHPAAPRSQQGLHEDGHRLGLAHRVVGVTR